MMTIERIARVLCSSLEGDPDRSVVTGGSFQNTVQRGMKRPDEGPHNWVRYAPLARAVLTAIRQPSALVADKAIAALGSVWQDDIGPTNACRLFEAMIDAALAEQ